MEEKLYVMAGDDFSLIKAAEAGVPYGAYNTFLQTAGLSQTDWASVLHMSERTLQRLRADKRKMDLDASERVLEMARLFEHGARVLGSKDALLRYLESAIPALGGKKPKDYLTTVAGIRFIYDELGRIEHGVLA